MKNKGLLMVVSGPSGVGKGTIVKRLVEKNQNIHLSVSATTREKRQGEAEGVSYFYKTKEEFEKLKSQGGFIESAIFCDNYYGTPKEIVLDKLEQGIDVVLEIEVMGAMQVRAKFPEGVYVFLYPPSMKVLEDRLYGRNTEDEENVQKRLKTAQGEFGYIDKYNYAVINDEVEATVRRLEAIIIAEKLRIERNPQFLKESGIL